ncbi:MAG TPA: response regulator, partial [Ktedonobacterales bacterium]|nr:response regulator [Ktedonobacterales bacterium]
MTGKQPSVLIVDDDADIRATLRVLFEEAGFQVSEAKEGAAAIVLLRSSPQPMVVFLDLMMPNGLGGDDALREIEQDGR